MRAVSERLWLMCDYSAAPVWRESYGAMVELRELPLREETRTRLWRWADWFEITSEMQALEGDWLCYFLCEAEAAAFEAEGLRLWRQVRSELAGRHEVGYRSERWRRRLWDPEGEAAREAERWALERASGCVSLYERAERLRSRPEVRELLARLYVWSEADEGRIDLNGLSLGVQVAVIAAEIGRGKLPEADLAALEQVGWPVFAGHPMPLGCAPGGGFSPAKRIQPARDRDRLRQ